MSACAHVLSDVVTNHGISNLDICKPDVHFLSRAFNPTTKYFLAFRYLMLPRDSLFLSRIAFYYKHARLGTGPGSCKCSETTILLDCQTKQKKLEALVELFCHRGSCWVDDAMGTYTTDCGNKNPADVLAQVVAAWLLLTQATGPNPASRSCSLFVFSCSRDNKLFFADSRYDTWPNFTGFLPAARKKKTHEQEMDSARLVIPTLVDQLERYHVYAFFNNNMLIRRSTFLYKES